ncbi:MAG: phage Gp37/Gp68 family protein [Nitrososphaerota archaeon]|nr:phage Gp37/Gp68 family protein [Nitrososphaerota archaeon]
MNNTKIQWTEMSWNPVWGCDKVSPGCKFCYAERIARAGHIPGSQAWVHAFDVRLWPERLTQPIDQKKPRLIFVCSMSDLFNEAVPDYYRIKIFETMNEASWHTFQVLTKRPEAMLRFYSLYADLFRPNIWIGVSVEMKQYLSRINSLTGIVLPVKFVSFEPLLGDLGDIRNYLKIVNWVIVGGESGPNARPMRVEWALSIRDQCRDAGVRFFFKQMGGTTKIDGAWGGHLLEGEEYMEMPSQVQGMRQMRL